MVPNYEYITRMNIIWFAVATLGLTVSLSKVKVGIWETLINNFKDINFQTTLVIHIQLLIISQVKSDSPPTPPSVSSELEIRSYNERDQNLSSFRIFKSKIKVLTKNRQFLIALLVFGSLQSSVNVFLSKVKIICYLIHSITPLKFLH